MPSATDENKWSRLFSIVRQSVSGKEMDYTQGSIRRAVVLLAIPMMLEMVMESVFALVDIFFVSHLGKHATSTVGLTESVITIVYSLAIGISMAATALVARRVGEKNYADATAAGMQAILVALAITITVSIPGFIFAKDILRLMGAEPQTVAYGYGYTKIVMGASLVIMLLFLINGVFRGAGYAMMAMKSLWLANFCNILLCPLLIRGWGPVPAFGLEGAAMATCIGRSIGVAYQLYHLFNGKSLLKVKLPDLKPKLDTIRSVIAIAWPGTLQFIVGSGSWIVLTSLVAQTGHSAASAGYQIGIRMLMFFFLPAWGMSNAAATLVGQNLGAKQPERAAQSVWRTARYNAVFLGLVSVFMIGFANQIIAFFTQDPEVAHYGVLTIRIFGSGYFIYGIGMVMTNAFNGAGDTKTPTIINLFGFWMFQVPLAWILSRSFQLGPTGVLIAIPIAETAITIAAIVLFKKGRWKQKKI